VNDTCLLWACFTDGRHECGSHAPPAEYQGEAGAGARGAGTGGGPEQEAAATAAGAAAAAAVAAGAADIAASFAAAAAGMSKACADDHVTRLAEQCVVGGVVQASS